jgi:hypothetical protein
MKLIGRRLLKLTIMSIVIGLGFTLPAAAQYIGANFGFNCIDASTGGDMANPDTGPPCK